MRTYERHQLKQDRFAATVTEQISWAVEHRNKLIYGLTTAGVILIVVAGLSYWWTYRNQQANTQLGAAMRTYEAPIRPANMPAPPDMVTFTSAKERARVAHAEFQKVADQYGRTKSGQMARYMAALTAIDLGDTAAGEKELKEVADSGNSDLAGLARLALAGVYQTTNRDKDALQLYKQLIDKPTPSVARSTAQLEMAMLLENTNQPGEAVKVYEDILKTDAGSGAAQLASERMSRMKTPAQQ